MSKQKPNPGTTAEVPDSDNLAGHFDRKAIHEAMRMAKGSAPEAHEILKKAGLDKTLKWFYEQLRSDRVLKAVWVDGRGNYSEHEPSRELAPQEAQAIEAELIQKDSEFLEQHGAEKVFGEDAELMLDYASFASKSFQTTVNITYGISVVAAKNLERRADYIHREILLNDEVVQRTETDKEGNVVQFDGPRYTDEEKLEWQKVYNDCMDKLCKFSTAATAAANAKIAAYKAEISQRKKKKSGRGGREFN